MLRKVESISLGKKPRIARTEYNAGVQCPLLIEQNAQKVLEFCDQAYIMQVGKVAISGRGRDLLEDNAVAAAYLGD